MQPPLALTGFQSVQPQRAPPLERGDAWLNSQSPLGLQALPGQVCGWGRALAFSMGWGREGFFFPSWERGTAGT